MIGSLEKNRYDETYCVNCGYNYSQQMYFDFRENKNEMQEMQSKDVECGQWDILMRRMFTAE